MQVYTKFMCVAVPSNRKLNENRNRLRNGEDRIEKEIGTGYVLTIKQPHDPSMFLFRRQMKCNKNQKCFKFYYNELFHPFKQIQSYRSIDHVYRYDIQNVKNLLLERMQSSNVARKKLQRVVVGATCKSYGKVKNVELHKKKY